MASPARLLGQALAYAAFAAVVGYFSASPRYTHLEPGMGVIRLSFSHAGERRQPCRRYSQEELEQLAPNMRRPLDCQRERVPLRIELELDGEVVYRDLLAPSGLAKDGASTAYRTVAVPAGSHHIAVRMSDSRRENGFDWQHEATVEIAPRQNFVIDFNARTGGFKFL